MRAATGKPQASPTQSSITQFAKVEKPNTLHISAKDAAASSVIKATAKRTFAAIMDSDNEGDDDDAYHTMPIKRLKSDADFPPKNKTANGQSNPQSLPTPESTPTKPFKYRDCLGSLSPLKQALHKDGDETIWSVGLEVDEEVDTVEDEAPERALPAELQDIINLQSAFVRALALHYAHHGTATPVQLATFLPSITKIWGKRAVIVEDIQRCLGLMRSSPSAPPFEFILYDYGRNQTCLEVTENTSLASTFTLNTLTAPFERTMHKAWQAHQSPFPYQLDQANFEEVAYFISTLPLQPITPSPNLKKIAPLFARGLQRLNSLSKSTSSSSKQQDSMTSNSGHEKANTKTTRAVLTRSNSLLERLKAKERANADAPATPSRSDLERKAALQRMPDMISTLCMLRAASSAGNVSSSSVPRRQTFSFPSLVQRIQDSSRSCMSREEVEKCVYILAEEVAIGCGFVEFVGTGKADGKKGLTAVVVDAAKMPQDMTRRIAEAMQRRSS